MAEKTKTSVVVRDSCLGNSCCRGSFECILHFNNGNRMKNQSCLWPGVSQCSNVINLYTQLLTLACLSVVSVVTCYFYGKALKKLKEIELQKEYELKNSAPVSSRYGKCKLTIPERAVVSFFTVFTIHCITQLPTYIYGIIVSSMALSNHNSETVDEGDITISAVGSVPILLLLATISFITTCSPLVLTCTNSKFKQHTMSSLQFISCTEYHLNEEKFLHQIQAKFPTEPTPSPSPVPPPNPAPKNMEVFYGPTGMRSKIFVKKSNIANYITSGHNLEVPGPADSSRPERVSESSLYVSRSPRPSRISTTCSSVGIAAANAGLALSAPGHRVLLNNFFPPDPSEAMAKELDAINFL